MANLSGLLNEDGRFMQIGTSPSNLTLQIPYPTIGKGIFQTSRMVDAGRNASGAVIGQMVGRSIDKQNMGWNVISCEKWWEINQFLEANGLFFYCRYFNHNLGEWKVRKFYAGDPQVEPRNLDPETQIPRDGVYYNATLNVIDCGEV